ncbi:MAG: hypothetical protein OEL83_11485 [Desulforhopalus sp.]|nr:hypothetical protein [Desulforhopalus sp.]
MNGKANPVDIGDYFFFLTAKRIEDGLSTSNAIYCDLIFKVAGKATWDRNKIKPKNDSFTFVGRPRFTSWSDEAWEDAMSDHFKWPSEKQHAWNDESFKKLTTYIGNKRETYQPQIETSDQVKLIDISSLLQSKKYPDIPYENPTKIDTQRLPIKDLVDYIKNNSSKKYRGIHLRKIREASNNEWMSSDSKQIRPRKQVY